MNVLRLLSLKLVAADARVRHVQQLTELPRSEKPWPGHTLCPVLLDFRCERSAEFHCSPIVSQEIMLCTMFLHASSFA